MATVGNLFINVKARTAGFSKKMKGVRATIGRLGTRLAKAGKKLALFGAAMGALALGAIVLITKKGLAAVDMLGKTADKLGILPKKLQALQLAATSSGVSVETFNMAMQRMVRRVAEAAMGTGEAVKALQELGLDAKKLSTLPVDEQFKNIADAMDKVAAQGDRVRLSMRLFDSEGVALVNTMKGGSKELTKFEKKAERLGLTLEKNQVKTVEKAVTELGFLSAIWQSLGNHLAVNVAPVLINISTVLQDMIVRAGGMNALAQGIVAVIELVAVGAVEALAALNTAWANVEAGIIAGAGSIAHAIGTLLGDDFKLIGDSLMVQAEEILLSAIHFEDNVRRLKQKFKELQFILKNQTPELDFDPKGKLELTAPALKGVIDNLQTAIGAFKVESSVTERQQAAMISIEKQQLATLKEIKTGVSSSSGVFT
tara:strand:- start:303 stop:1586 length:1284 start_codon:yes stop_codon:yes gene_type:complete